MQLSVRQPFLALAILGVTAACGLASGSAPVAEGFLGRPGRPSGSGQRSPHAAASTRLVPIVPITPAGPEVLPVIDVQPAPRPWKDAPAADVWAAYEAKELPSVSYGKANHGGLWGGVQLTDDELIHVRMPERTWVTVEVASQLRAALSIVHDEHPGTAPLQVGDGSRRRGGWLRPHRSHQSGRDLDVGFFYQDPDTWYADGTKKNLDLPRCWSFVRALLAVGDVEYVFVDRSIIGLLRAEGLRQGATPEYLDAVLEGPLNRNARVRHTWGHRNHFHIRFYSNRARAAAKRLYPLLKRWGKL